MRLVKEVVLAWPLLALLLLIDGIFIGLHVWLWYMGWLEAVPQLNLERRGSASEFFNYLKWLTCSLAGLWLFARRREPLYLAWAALFTCFLVEDAESFRTEAGARIAELMGWGPTLALTGPELGELVAASTVGAILLGAIAFAYWRSDDREAKAFSRDLLPWLGAFIIFGIGVDMIHTMVSHRTMLSAFLGVVEETGEMIVASILTSIVCLQAVPVTRGVMLTARS